MHTEFQRVEQRKAYEACMASRAQDLRDRAIKFPDDFCAKAWNQGFTGGPDNFDHRGHWYAYWCAGRDCRDNMRKAA